MSWSTKVLAALLVAVWIAPPVGALDGAASGTFITVVPPYPLTQQPQTIVGTTNFSLPVATGVLVCTSFRWLIWPDSAWATAQGDRVAFLRVDGADVGALMINEALPNNLVQFSTGACYSASLPAGLHTAAVHFGGLGLNQSFFTTGRVDVTW